MIQGQIKRLQQNLEGACQGTVFDTRQDKAEKTILNVTLHPHCDFWDEGDAAL